MCLAIALQGCAVMPVVERGPSWGTLRDATTGAPLAGRDVWVESAHDGLGENSKTGPATAIYRATTDAHGRWMAPGGHRYWFVLLLPDAIPGYGQRYRVGSTTVFTHAEGDTLPVEPEPGVHARLSVESRWRWLPQLLPAAGVLGIIERNGGEAALMLGGTLALTRDGTSWALRGHVQPGTRGGSMSLGLQYWALDTLIAFNLCARLYRSWQGPKSTTSLGPELGLDFMLLRLALSPQVRVDGARGVRSVDLHFTVGARVP